MRGVDKLRLAVAATIVALYVMATIYSATHDGYDVPSDLRNLMMIVAGFLFTPSIIRAARQRSDRSDDDPR